MKTFNKYLEALQKPDDDPVFDVEFYIDEIEDLFLWLKKERREFGVGYEKDEHAEVIPLEAKDVLRDLKKKLKNLYDSIGQKV